MPHLPIYCLRWQQPSTLLPFKKLQCDLHTCVCVCAWNYQGCEGGEYVLYMFQGFIAIQESFLREFSWRAHKWAICKSFLHENYVFFRQCFLLYGRGECVCERSHAVFGRLQLKSTESEGLENLIMVVMLWCQVDRRGIDIWVSGHPLSYLFEVAKNEVTWFYSLVTVATWFYSLVTLPDLVVPCWHRDEENPSICCVTHWSRSGEVQRT